MAHWFDDLTKSFVDDTNGTLSRRRAVRNIAGVIAGMTLASWFPGQVLAQAEYTHVCKDPGTCSTNFFDCDLNRYQNTNCYCFQQIGTGRVGGYVAATRTVLVIPAVCHLAPVIHRPIVERGISASPILAVAVPMVTVSKSATRLASFLQTVVAEL